TARFACRAPRAPASVLAARGCARASEAPSRERRLKPAAGVRPAGAGGRGRPRGRAVLRDGQAAHAAERRQARLREHGPVLVDRSRVLERSPAWTDPAAGGMRSWMSAYLQWLRTSEIGKEERSARNNHGTWYDAQVAALALFTGDTALARATLEASKTKRIGSQVMPDGRQPFELVRTRSLAYSAMNLEGLCRPADLGRQVGVDLWSYQSPDGGSIRNALDYVAPYAAAATRWPGQEI